MRWERCAKCGREYAYPHLCREHMLCGICHPPMPVDTERWAKDQAIAAAWELLDTLEPHLRAIALEGDATGQDHGDASSSAHEDDHGGAGRDGSADGVQ